MNNSAYVPLPFINTPGCQWFWENYNKCLQWQQKHQLACLKASLTAVQIENNFLENQVQFLTKLNGHLIDVNHKLAHGVDSGTVMDYSSYGQHRDAGHLQQVESYNNSNYQYSSEPMNVCDDGNDSDEEEYELSEEYVKFIEISLRHKLEMKKLTETNVNENNMGKGTKDDVINKKEGGVCDTVFSLNRKEKRSKEMSLLYGEAAPKIHAMETAIQLSFNRNTDVFQPTLWPQIPFNIDYAEHMSK